MFTDRGFRTRLAAAAITLSLSLATSAGVQAQPNHAAALGPITVLHSFARTDGANPQGGLELGFGISGGTVTSTVYGTTQFGGVNGAGAIFAQGTVVNSSFQDLFNFNTTNGADPAGGLAGVITDYTVNGPFFGVTSAGGKNGLGDIYEATANVAQTVVYSFTGGSDGSNPVGRLLFFHGSLYGTTSTGAHGYGTVFRFLPNSGLHTLHQFTNGNDGATPLSGLALRLTIPFGNAKARAAALNGRAIDARKADSRFVDSALYGTTSSGGASGAGTGTLFKISPDGTFKTLFTFGDTPAAPGATPSAELQTDFNGNLYGTTANGGSAGAGEVFVYTAGGAFRVLHDFAVDVTTGIATTGATPLAALTIGFNGVIYGTTSSGSINGLGNVFRIDSNGFSLKYEFAGPDGASPEGKLVDGLDGNLYGTTNSGGTNGYGEIFAIGE